MINSLSACVEKNQLAFAKWKLSPLLKQLRKLCYKASELYEISDEHELSEHVPALTDHSSIIGLVAPTRLIGEHPSGYSLEYGVDL